MRPDVVGQSLRRLRHHRRTVSFRRTREFHRSEKGQTPRSRIRGLACRLVYRVFLNFQPSSDTECVSGYRKVPFRQSDCYDKRQRMDSIPSKKYLIVPIPKNPYSRIGPLALQDYYQQLKRTGEIARELKAMGNEVAIAIISAFHPLGSPSEIAVYSQILLKLAPELTVLSYKETNDTAGQVERGFRLASEMAAVPVFITTWMHYPRVRYLARGRPAQHYAAFGIPQPLFLFIDPFCLVFQPIGDVLEIGRAHV